MDTSIVLNQIFLKIDNNQTVTLDSVKKSRATDSTNLLVPVKIQSTAAIFSSLSDNQMAALEGFLYITTSKQSNDYNFKVFDVDKVEMIRTSFLICDPCTMVFLNTQGKTTPVQSATINTWRQSDDSTVKMYRGFPTDDDEDDSTQIFSNPIQTISNNWLRIPTVERFSVSLGSFYFKATKDFYFGLSPYFLDLDSYVTTGYHTTGLYMKSIPQVAKNITIFCVRDSRFNETTGANIIGSLPNPDGKVIVGENDVILSESITVAPAHKINGWTINHIGQNITISSRYAGDGEYFVQYIVLQDQMISSTFAPTEKGSMTTKSMETTTQGTSRTGAMGGVIILTILSWIM